MREGAVALKIDLNSVRLAYNELERMGGARSPLRVRAHRRQTDLLGDSDVCFPGIQLRPSGGCCREPTDRRVFPAPAAGAACAAKGLELLGDLATTDGSERVFPRRVRKENQRLG